MRRAWRACLLRLMSSQSAHDSDDSADVVAIFARVDQLLYQRHFEPVLDDTRRALRYRMSQRQRLHMLFARAYALGELHEYAQARRIAEEALDIAVSLHDRHALREARFLRAEMSRDLDALGDAAEDYQLCFNALYEADPNADRGARGGAFSDASSLEFIPFAMNGRPPSDDPSLELDVLLGQYMVHFPRGRVESCRRLLDLADPLVARMPRSPESHLQQGLILWLRALLDRWDELPWVALTDAEGAVQCFAEEAALPSANRLLSVMAEIVLDCVWGLRLGTDAVQHTVQGDRHGKVLRPWYDEDRLLQIAERRTLSALQLAREGGDTPGEVMALLALGRYRRYIRLNENRLPILEGSLFTARHLDDTPLLIQVLSALGDEFAEREEIGSALNQCVQAMTVAERAGIPAMARWARKLYDELRGSDGDAS